MSCILEIKILYLEECNCTLMTVTNLLFKAFGFSLKIFDFAEISLIDTCDV